MTNMKTRKILLSIKPEYVDKILTQAKKFEYRKQRCKSNVDTIVIYSTHPVMRVIGEVEILDVIEDTPNHVWQQTKEFSGISKQFFDSYFSGRTKAIAYKLGVVNIYPHPKLLSDIGIKSAPQSFVYLNRKH